MVSLSILSSLELQILKEVMQDISSNLFPSTLLSHVWGSMSTVGLLQAQVVSYPISLFSFLFFFFFFFSIDIRNHRTH